MSGDHAITPGAAALADTERAQADAADPLASAWVNANAGAGKTHVLVLRVLRLMLSGVPPERILCLTYTKAAAAEMSKRVFDALAKWAVIDDARLRTALEKMLDAAPTAEDMTRSRTLFARAIETPGGLKVQTIHAFAERLLQRFPLEAGVTPGFKILDDAEGRELKSRAINAALVEATSRSKSALGKALHCVIRYAAEANFDALLSNAIEEREWLVAASRIDPEETDDDFAGAEALLRRALDVPQTATTDSLEAERAAVLSDADLREIADVLRTGGRTDAKHAAMLERALSHRDPKLRCEWMYDWFLTSKGEPRGSLIGVSQARARPELQAISVKAQMRFSKTSEHIESLRLVDATTALYRLAAAVLQHYVDAKQTSGGLDFDDLIERATSLLAGGRQGAAEWVLYKLDGGLDHILVDEAQDTSPAQWKIIEALAGEFFSGDGARDERRTLFAVGDEKQSIYSFQGAAPEKFAEMGQRFAELAANARTPWRRVPLHLSFRSTQAVLECVDAVFSNPAATPGLTAAGDPVVHAAIRLGQAGLVEIWPTETPSAVDGADPWRPLEDESERAPANRLANRIADTIARWLNSGDILKSQGRAVRPGDILILVRRRNPFATPMVAALKKRGIPVAGRDRITLTEQIVVQDLMAIGDFLTLPEDDLALASVLKGPIFGLDDDDLLAIAVGRKGALWKALLEMAKTDSTFNHAAESLKRWRSKADFAPPFEFFSNVLDRDGGRTRLLHRLGPEAADAIDEFLDLALAYDDRAAPSMAGFLADLRAAKSDVKRDMDLARDEVRVMTVHGAKGLEAGIVFLPDTCTTANGESNGSRLLKLPDAEKPDGLPDPILWAVKGTSRLAGVRRATNATKVRDTEERNRLLYVAMTRAKDRLYVAGFDGRNMRPADCWYNHVANRLAPMMQEIETADGCKVLRIECEQVAKTEDAKGDSRSAVEPIKPPEFARRRAPSETQLSAPLAPSRLEPYAPDAEGEPVVVRAPADSALSNDAPSPLATSDARRFLRGTLTHTLLQHLPEIEPAKRQAAAEAFVARRGAGLSATSRASIVSESLALLSSPDFEALFAPGTRAEVAISAVIPHPSSAGPALRLSGQLDRLAVTENDVLIVDYKTNRPPPLEVSGVADAYLFQLAAYVLALREIYPDKSVRAALLWTDGPRLMHIPETVIGEAIEKLWSLDLASLDAP